MPVSESRLQAAAASPAEVPGAASAGTGVRAAPRHAPCHQPESMKGVRLLVVDDEALISFAMRRFFHAHGFEVDCASELPEARRLIAERCYDMVIADLRLSGLGSTEGLDVIDWARARCPAARSILLTSYGSPAIEATARSRGAAAMILKPLALERLLAVVSGLLVATPVEAP
jgi:two-component system, NtrC family, response regulator PilR